MAPRSSRGAVVKPAVQARTVPSRTNLKRKRSNLESTKRLNKVIRSIRTDRGLPIAASIESGGSPPKDTTSETSGLTSADGYNTGTSATALESDEGKGKQASEGRALSGEGNRTAEIITAYRNAMEILVELANRDRYRAYAQSHLGFGGPGTYSTPYVNGPLSTHTTPHASTFTTPYANHASTSYVTPYANPPEPVEVNGNSHSHSDISPESHTVDDQSQEDQIDDGGNIGGSTNDADPETMIDAESEGLEHLDEFAKDDDEMSLTSPLNIDSFLALANGGVPPGQQEELEDDDQVIETQATNISALDAPPSPADTIDQALSRADEDVQILIDHICNKLMESEDPPSQVPPGNPYAAFYSTMNGKQLGAELKRLVALAHPEVNAIMPREQIQAAHLFFTHLVSHMYTRNAAIIRPIPVQYPNFAPPNQWGQAIYPPPPPPKGYMVQWHDSITGAPMDPPPQATTKEFIPRGNVIAPPAVRDVDKEQKVDTYGFPPKPSGRPGLRSGGRKRKKGE